jgi:O-antigen/teichoic acid export membrane protein
VPEPGSQLEQAGRPASGSASAAGPARGAAIAARGRALVAAALPDPLLRNATSLMLNTALTGGTGLAYWLIAARRYAPAEVGRASAALAAMNLLAGVTALSLTGSLTRFIPQSGHGTRALVLRVYAVSAGVSALGGVLFVFGAGRLGPSYAELTTAAAGAAFIISVVGWAIFTLQDGVLIGLRSAVWLPAENGLFGAVKIVLLIALATAMPRGGIFLSWMLPVFLALPLVNLLIFARIIPQHASRTGHRQPPTARQVSRFLAGDYVGATCLLVTGSLVPVLVALLTTPRLTAYFYVAWTVGATLDLLGVNMATSLTVEGAFDAGRLAASCASALRRGLIVLVPTTAVLAAAAYPLMALFGPGYARFGAPVLALLAAATLPRSLTELYLGALRAQSRTSRVALVQAVRGVVLLAGVLLLTSLLGVIGAAIGVLAGQLLAAALILPGLWRLVSGARLPAAARRREV